MPRRSPETDRSAFTIVELMTVILIVSVLMALLIPAVQSARESARRASCTNNLKQVGLTIVNFEAARHRLPIARGPTSRGARVGGSNACPIWKRTRRIKASTCWARTTVRFHWMAKTARWSMAS